MTRNAISRRRLLQGAAGALALPALLAPRISFAAPASGEARFVFVILRGALDGLAAAPPIGDPAYARVRGEMALRELQGLQRLDGTFALHPALAFMAEQWNQQQMSLLHAVATPYRERSHFDAQDVLENGHARPHASTSGWLNRALAGLPAARGRTQPQTQQAAVALGAAVPLVLRGPAEVASWSPGRQPHMEDDTLQRLADLYATDPLLSRRLAEATASQEMAAEGQDMQGGRGGGAQLAQAAGVAAGFLTRPQGPRVAVMETTGWDTHANQGSTEGVLAARLTALDAGLRALHAGLGAAWRNTVVLVATEFGRTVAINGTRGTDHGTGAAAFLLGGAVNGRVVADWPGLGAGSLFEGRDLKPTLDLRAVMAALLANHLGIDPSFIAREVFPDAPRLARIEGLVRSA